MVSKKQATEETEQAPEAQGPPEPANGKAAAPARASRRGAAKVTGSEEPADEALLARLERADTLADGGSAAEAAEAYAAVAAAAPRSLRAALGHGMALAAQAKYDAAEKELRRALTLAPDAVEVHLQLGITLYRKGVYAAAATTLRRVVELDPESATAYVVLGEALNQMADSDAAIEALQEAVRLQPASRAYYAMGIAYDRKGNFDRAAEMYRLSREVANR